MSIFSKNNKPKQNKLLKPLSAKGDDKASKIGEKVILAIALVFCAGIAVGAVVAFKALSAICREECRVSSQECVSVVSGKMISPELIISRFGLTNGVNLAEVPFAEIRSLFLKNVPQIKEITITRRMPDKVRIEVVEREPAVRLSGDGRVADAEGVVFEYYRGTSMLPLITDNDAASDAMPGNKLSGHAAAALRLILSASSKNGDAPPLRILKADATKTDYLLLTLADYTQAMFAWPNMDDDTPAAREAMADQIAALSTAIATKIGSSGKMWDARIPGRAFCKIPELEQD